MPVLMRFEGPDCHAFSSESKRASSYTVADSSVSSSLGEGTAPDTSLPAAQQKRAAKIHDFCLGIPFGEIAQVFPS